MYELYDKEGILRFVNSDKDACLAYAELFEISSTNYSLMNLVENIEKDKEKDTILLPNQEENNN